MISTKVQSANRTMGDDKATSISDVAPNTDAKAVDNGIFVAEPPLRDEEQPDVTSETVNNNNGEKICEIAAANSAPVISMTEKVIKPKSPLVARVPIANSVSPDSDVEFVDKTSVDIPSVSGTELDRWKARYGSIVWVLVKKIWY